MLEILSFYFQKSEVGSIFTWNHIKKLALKWTKALNILSTTAKLLEDSIEQKSGNASVTMMISCIWHKKEDKRLYELSFTKIQIFFYIKTFFPEE